MSISYVAHAIIMSLPCWRHQIFPIARLLSKQIMHSIIFVLMYPLAKPCIRVIIDRELDVV